MLVHLRGEVLNGKNRITVIKYLTDFDSTFSPLRSVKELLYGFLEISCVVPPLPVLVGG